MPIEITIPRLGWNMDEGVFVAWLKNDGDAVKAGEPIFSLETDKAVQEIESLDSGTLRRLPSGPRPGDTLPVGTVIAHIVRAAEAEPASVGIAASEAPAWLSPDDENPPVRTDRPRARPVADVTTHSSPRARRKARDLGIDWTKLDGTGRGGRVRERDVTAAAGTAGAVASAVDDYSVIPIDATRRTIAERMMECSQGTAAVTLTTTIDATNLVNLRQQFKAVALTQGSPADAIVIGYADIVIKLAALALEKHPIMNSRWDGDRILLLRGIHVGLAVDTEAGLMVPVIRDVPALSLREVAARSRELADRARRRKVSAEELQGGTFTVTNLGSYGVDVFTPIINLPQCSVLGLGRIQAHPAVSHQQLTARERMTLSLTFDHRIVDGAPAARFLQTLSSLLENPSPWLLT
jgi:pyruvate dehydrogenase E2 component (dihydrolipoamide acetyltransferase)